MNKMFKKKKWKKNKEVKYEYTQGYENFRPRFSN